MQTCRRRRKCAISQSQSNASGCLPRCPIEPPTHRATTIALLAAIGPHSLSYRLPHARPVRHGTPQVPQLGGQTPAASHPTLRQPAQSHMQQTAAGDPSADQRTQLADWVNAVAQQQPAADQDESARAAALRARGLAPSATLECPSRSQNAPPWPPTLSRVAQPSHTSWPEANTHDPIAVRGVPSALPTTPWWIASDAEACAISTVRCSVASGTRTIACSGDSHRCPMAAISIPRPRVTIIGRPREFHATVTSGATPWGSMGRLSCREGLHGSLGWWMRRDMRSPHKMTCAPSLTPAMRWWSCQANGQLL